MTKILEGKLNCSFEEGIEAAVCGRNPLLNERSHRSKIKRIDENASIRTPLSWDNYHVFLRERASYCGNDPQLVEDSQDLYRLIAPSIVWVPNSLELPYTPGVDSWETPEMKPSKALTFEIFVCATDKQISDAKKVNDERWERINERQRRRETKDHDYWVRCGRLPPDTLYMPTVTIFRKNPLVTWYK
jgi:hypothetical protein